MYIWKTVHSLFMSPRRWSSFNQWYFYSEDGLEKVISWLHRGRFSLAHSLFRSSSNTKLHIGRSCVFEPSLRHRSQYSNYDTYGGLVTVDGTIASSDVFNIVMTNKSKRHIKIHSNQTMGMLHSCVDSQICTIHEIVSFDGNPKGGRDDTSKPDIAEGNFYYVVTRNPKTSRLEVNTLPRKAFYPVQVNEAGSLQDYMHYRKPSLLDALVNKQTRNDLDRLLKVNHDAFADDECCIMQF